MDRDAAARARRADGAARRAPASRSSFADGEEIRTEISAKFTRAAVERGAAGRPARARGLFTDDGGLFGLAWRRRADPRLGRAGLAAAFQAGGTSGLRFRGIRRQPPLGQTCLARSGWIDTAEDEAGGWRLSGWALHPEQGPFEAIHAHWNGEDLGVATPVVRPDLAERRTGYVAPGRGASPSSCPKGRTLAASTCSASTTDGRSRGCRRSSSAAIATGFPRPRGHWRSASGLSDAAFRLSGLEGVHRHVGSREPVCTLPRPRHGARLGLRLWPHREVSDQGGGRRSAGLRPRRRRTTVPARESRRALAQVEQPPPYCRSHDGCGRRGPRRIPSSPT